MKKLLISSLLIISGCGGDLVMLVPGPQPDYYNVRCNAFIAKIGERGFSVPLVSIVNIDPECTLYDGEKSLGATAIIPKDDLSKIECFTVVISRDEITKTPCGSVTTQ